MYFLALVLIWVDPRSLSPKLYSHRHGPTITRRLRPARACFPTTIPRLSQPHLQDASFYLCSGLDGMLYLSQVSLPKTGVRQCDGPSTLLEILFVDSITLSETTRQRCTSMYPI